MLEKRIREDLKKALKGGEELKLSVLRLVVSSIENKKKQKRFSLSQEKEISEPDIKNQDQLSEKEILEVILGETKKRKESIKSFEIGGREDLALKEKEELRILSEYLPEEISEEEIIKIIKSTIKELGAMGSKDIGKVMALIMPKLKGKADGTKVSEIVRDILA